MKDRLDRRESRIDRSLCIPFNPDSISCCVLGGDSHTEPDWVANGEPKIG